MSTQIRLADRQGLLHGRGLSPVQVKCLYLAELRDLRERSRERDEDFRVALLATGNFEFAELFPEAVEATSEEQIDKVLANDEAEVTYVFTDEVDPIEAERLLAQLMDEASSGEVSGEHFLGGI